MVKHGIGIEDTDHTYTVKVESFRYHLRAHQDISLALLEVMQNLLIVQAATGCIQIHTGHSRLGEVFLYQILNTFRSVTMASDICLFTIGTLRRNRIDRPAIMASQLMGVLVISETYITILASGNPSTYITLDRRSISTAVLEKDDLLALFQGRLYGLKKLRTERAFHQTLPLKFLHIHYLYTGQLYILESCFQSDKSVFSRLYIIITFQTRRGGAQQHLCPTLMGKHYGGIAGMIARSRVFLLETLLMLFVNDNKPQVFKRKENAASNAQKYIIRLVGKHFLIHLHTFRIGITGMVDTQSVSEYPLQSFGQLCCQHNLGKEI